MCIDLPYYFLNYDLYCASKLKNMSDVKWGIGSKVKHPSFGLGVVCNLNEDYYKIYFTTSDEIKEIARSFENMETVERVTPEVNPPSLADIEGVLENVLEKFGEEAKPVEMASKWIGGSIDLVPGSSDLQGKSVPIKTFFSKIISVREKLRVLEQNINNHDKLDEADKLQLQQYISRAYGSLTTFNVLFAKKDDHFVGTGKSA